MLSSCKYGTNITIKNESSSKIDSLLIEGGGSILKHQNIEIGESFRSFVDFRKIKQKGEGVLVLKYYKKNKKELHHFGYFSNGIPPSNDIKIFIKKDTILFK